MTLQIAVADLADWIRQRRAGAARLLVGICGPPGGGKSTLASMLSVQFAAPVVPMDGFHLSNAVLDERGTRGIKGAPDTFDAAAFVAAVRTIRYADEAILLPGFDRAIDEPIPDAIRIPRSTPVILVEGNYLLLDDDPWSRLPHLLDVTVYLDFDEDMRIDRLIARHVEFGKSFSEATAFVRDSDERNAALVAASKDRADVIVVEE